MLLLYQIVWVILLWDWDLIVENGVFLNHALEGGWILKVLLLLLLTVCVLYYLLSLHLLLLLLGNVGFNEAIAVYATGEQVLRESSIVIFSVVGFNRWELILFRQVGLELLVCKFTSREGTLIGFMTELKV